jgi:hypothetical protein
MHADTDGELGVLTASLTTARALSATTGIVHLETLASESLCVHAPDWVRLIP